MACNHVLKGIYHLRNMPRDNFGFAEHQEKDTNGLGCKLTLTGKKDEAVRDKAAVNDDARFKIEHFHWYVHH